VNNITRLRADIAQRVHVRHHIVPESLFMLRRVGKINVV
jgi:hypothetical protein